MSNSMSPIERRLANMPQSRKNSISLNMTISARVGDLYDKSGMTLEQVFEKSAIYGHTFESMMGGLHEFTICEVCVLAELFQVKPFDLMQ